MTPTIEFHTQTLQIRAVLADHRVGVLRKIEFGWGKRATFFLLLCFTYPTLSSRSETMFYLGIRAGETLTHFTKTKCEYKKMVCTPCVKRKKKYRRHNSECIKILNCTFDYPCFFTHGVRRIVF